jgi:hypothetical protein
VHAAPMVELAGGEAAQLLPPPRSNFILLQTFNEKQPSLQKIFRRCVTLHCTTATVLSRAAAAHPMKSYLKQSAESRTRLVAQQWAHFSVFQPPLNPPRSCPPPLQPTARRLAEEKKASAHESKQTDKNYQGKGRGDAC